MPDSVLDNGLDNYMRKTALQLTHVRLSMHRKGVACLHGGLISSQCRKVYVL